MRLRLQTLAVLLVLPLALAGCDRVRAKAAYKDGNKDYRAEDFRHAVEKYSRAVELDPAFAEAWFYLGSSYQALYRPGKPDPNNKTNIEAAILNYKTALEKNLADTPNRKLVRLNTLAALTAIYSDEPYREYDTALGYAKQLVETAPDDPKNLYAMAGLFEKFAKTEEAEKTYTKVATEHPQDNKACGALAAFYNKPNWDDDGAVWVEGSDKPRRAKFDQAIEILTRCAGIDPNDASGWQKVATFYWDKAYRDPFLSDEQKDRYADKGLEAADKAMQIKPDYFEAVVFRGLLYRVKAMASTDRRVKEQFLAKATEAQKMAMEMKRNQPAPEASAAP